MSEDEKIAIIVEEILTDIARRGRGLAFQKKIEREEMARQWRETIREILQSK